MADDGSPLDISSGAGGGALSGFMTAGLGAISGNPLAIGAGVLGIGMSIVGGFGQADAAKKTAAAQQRIAGLEQQQDAARKQAMELSAQRQQMEVLRNAQRARSLALNNATSQGAQFGSGLQGGYGQIEGQSGVNLLGISQNLQAGEQMFGLNAQINTQKMNIAGASSTAAMGAGFSSLGSGILGNLGIAKNLSTNFTGSSGSSGNLQSYGGWMSSMGSNGTY